MTHTLTTRRGVLSGAAATSALIASGSFKAHAADTVVGFIYVGSRADTSAGTNLMPSRLPHSSKFRG
jgi:hypothetical protein